MGVLQILERTPSLAGVERTILASLAAASTTRTLSRKERIWNVGDAPRAFVVVRSGLVKVVRTLAGGRSVICGLFGAPDSVGDLALLKNVPYPASAFALTEGVELVLVPRSVVITAMQESHSLSSSLLCQAQNKLQGLLRTIDVLGAGSVEARLAALLMSLYERFGDDFEDGSSGIPVALSRQELADLVCTSTETAIRIMTRWERMGVVATDDHGFTVSDFPQLQTISKQQ